jgi:FixJ family two-component response regulator
MRAAIEVIAFCPGGRHQAECVDDEHLIAQTLTEILKKSGFAARGFTNPHEALDEHSW